MALANGIETQDIEVWTEGSKIVFVGKPKAEELDGKVFEREYDLKGNLLMPSFKNAHTHSAMTFLWTNCSMCNDFSQNTHFILP